MSGHIRVASLADIEGLLALEAEFPEEDRFDRRTWCRLMAGQSRVLVYVEADGAICGGCVLLHSRRTRIARLYSVSVAHRARGAGIGGALIEACEACAAGLGKERMRLEVRQSNCSAIRLYQRAGYRVIASLESYYPDGEAALRMEKSLNAPSDGAP